MSYNNMFRADRAVIFLRKTRINFAIAVFGVLVIFIVHVPFAQAAKPKCTLALTSTPSTQSIPSGGNLTYTFSIKDTGRESCASTAMSVYYASNENFVSATPTPSAKTNYYWSLGQLNPGQTSTVTVITQDIPDGTPTISNEACASATGAADACVDVSTVVAQSTQNPSSPIAPPATTTPPVGTTTPISTSSTKEYGVWFWDSPYAMTWTQSQQLLDQAKANGFNAVYITVDDYLPIASEPDGAQKTQDIQNYDAAVQKFITYANQNGIAVDAEGGASDWAEPANIDEPYGIMDFVTQYNNTHTAKFRYVQYDVEPYLLPEYSTDEVGVLTQYVTMVNQLVAHDTSGIGIEMVIPHFYGSQEGWTPNITYNGQTGSTFTLVLAALDELPNDSMIEMAYRNYALGSGGTIDISSADMAEASQPGHSTKLIIAQETGNVQPPYVTFYGMSKSDLLSQISIINSTYATSSAFQGIAIDYIDPFLALN